VSVAVPVVFDDHRNAMLARTTYGARQIGPPGRRIEQGESPVAAGRREFSEETGFEIHVDRLIGIYSFTDEDHEAFVYAFLCSIVGGELQIQRDEISEVIWSDPREMLYRVVRHDRIERACREAHAPSRFGIGKRSSVGISPGGRV
jgi:8-oxo-dGTP pyrophosphatase MutT (NUDIX family)